MNIQAFNPALSTNGFAGPGFQNGSNVTLTMMQTLIQLMMSLMQMQKADGGLLAGNSPSFGCGCGAPNLGGSDGNYGSGGSGNLPSFDGFGGGEGAPGTGGFGGGGGVPSAGGFNGRDGYVPSGTGPSGAVGNLGSGQGSDAARWALGQEGVSESNNASTVRGYSRGRWQPWCADFVSQAYANSPGGSPFGHQSSVSGILNWGRQNNKFFDASTAASNPGMLKAGDIAVWKSSGKSHVGLVTGVNPDGTFSTIEGNSGDAVRRRTHSFGSGLTGFVRPRG